MPIYEYECESCGTHFDKLQSMNDAPIRQCPECSGSVHKVFQPTGIIFKGSGWYITDSRKSTSSAVTGESKSSDKDKDKDKGSETKVKTEGNTEAKPEAKTESKTEAKAESSSKPAIQ
jgi:putative FmdB family regulatory protein